jgi:hypothetical protein
VRFDHYPSPGLTPFLMSVRREHRVFVELIDSYPGLLARLTDGEEEDIILLGEFVSFYSALSSYSSFAAR